MARAWSSFGQELGVREVGADGQQRVAVHHHLVGRDRAEQPDRAGDPRQVVGQHVLAEQRLGRAGAEQVGELGQLGDAAARALPDEQRDLLAGVEDVGRLRTAASSAVTVEADMPRLDGTCLNACPGGVVVQFEDVGREDDAGRRVFAERDADRPVDQVRQLLGHRAHLHVVAADVLEQAQQIDLLLVRAAHRRAFGLPDDRHDRHVVELRVVQPVEQMDRARAAGRRRTPPTSPENFA